MASSVSIDVLDERTKATNARVDKLERKVDWIIFFQLATLVTVLINLLFK